MSTGDIAVVLFDLGGVLFHYAPENRWRRFSELTGLDPETVAKRLSGSGYSQACDQGRFRGSRAYREGIRALGSRLSMERFVEAWVSAFKPNDEVIQIAISVKQRASVALLSNNSDLVRQGLETRWPAELAPFMPRIFSADLGLSKPDPRAFSQAALLLGQEPEHILLVDEAPANTDSAAALGFRTHRFENPASLREALRA